MKNHKNNFNYTFSRRYPISFGCTFTIIIFFLLTLDIVAQVKVYPVKRKEAGQEKSSTNARTQITEPLNLPFFDDFSFTPVDDPNNPASNYPLDSIWVNSRSTWISSGLGISAPSIHVASFDGLDSLGLPYSDVALASGFCDKLISRTIDLSDPAVPLVARTSVWLSFKYQWYGNGEPPDQNDFIRLLFKDVDNVWVEVMEILPKESFDRTVFYDTIIQVSNARFFHDKFQFRFENRGRKTGPFDTWNLDYIYLNKGRTSNDNAFPDRTAASGISTLFGDYYSIPIKHLLPAMELDTPAFEIQNLSDEPGSTFGYSVRLNVKNYKDGLLTEVNDLLIDSIATSVIVVGPFQRFVQEFDYLPDLSDNSIYHLDSDSINISLDAFVQAGDKVEPDFGNLNFRVNDVVSTRYSLNNYYAYDDGTAEYAAGNVRAGDRFVYAFDMLTPDPDTLAGFYAYFPDFSLTANRVINIHIYKDNNGFPQDIPFYSIPNYTVKKMGLNKFQFIRIVEPLIVTGRFYIGFESVTVRVGLDMSHDTGDRIFESVNTVWRLAEIQGSLMIRPVFGEGNGEGPITGIHEERTVSLYPNPNKGQFFLQGNAKLLQAYSMAGRPVAFTSEDLGETQQISLQNPAAGFYILKIKKGDKVVTEKMVIY